ncbi:Hypothetical protein NTJ_04212 [Nesidiocoris tenuis]|uniref:MD-2-related lipid-recognition domain-containing protein n=1 Tax=Nesidiocoris tenuis TaxID=355587 RepID=A0ABN7AGP7_9HEMI|nr:Hypothetical protein NTJ_04212 [Nesidiocoris tenuis]
MRTVVRYLSALCVFLVAVCYLDAVPSVGPAEIVIRHGESCGLKIPSLIDYHIRYYKLRRKYVVQLNFTAPWTFSDEIGMVANVAVKRNGAWKPNFFVIKGDKVCTALKNSQYEVFKLFAKSLNAPDPPSCPLPAGTVKAEFDPDINLFQEKNHINVLPYGELRLIVNMTRRGDVVACFKYFFDVVPKRSPIG